MRIVLLITLFESALIAVLMMLWRFKNAKTLTRVVAASSSRVAWHEPTSRGVAQDSRWNFINGWKVAPQSDDRRPALDAASFNKGTAAGGRSDARRRHQAMYKRWSQDRHD